MKRIPMIMVCCWLMAAVTFAETVPFGKGKLTVTYVASNAVRIQYSEGEMKNELPDWAYVSHDNLKKHIRLSRSQNLVWSKRPSHYSLRKHDCLSK